ncbi:MAG: M3 family oligoendopeptidase [Fimbriimonadaceae bacterium]
MPVASISPRWDLTPFFPSVDSPQLHDAIAQARKKVAELSAWFDANGIDAGASPERAAEKVESLIQSLNELGEEMELLGAYLSCVVTTDTRNADAQARMSELDQIASEASNLRTRFAGWIGSQSVQDLVEHSASARNHRFMLEKASIKAQHLMSPAEEALAAELRLTGSTAWSKLHSDVTSQIEVELELETGKETVPMSHVRTLAYERDREVRRAGYEAEMRTWKAFEVPLAAAMNSIKGEVSTLCRRRNWGSPLDEALFGANIDRPTLDAMMNAAKASFPMFRRYLRAKASLLGQATLPWFDMYAPVAQTASWNYDSACEFVERHFRSYSDRMGDFARRTFDENWIDVPPAPGKVDGAYCATVRKDESRILMNFKPSFTSVSTLAHELGHAYHSLCLAPRTELQKTTPMTLAETASIFCETIVRQAALREGSDAERLAILEGSLQGACGVVVDISSRFLFEQSVFAQRPDRELSPAELCEMMLSAQKQTYGDGLDEAFLHPYMWALKPHYYDADSFYNYPYMFGFLFGLGLYAQYEQDPNAFRSGYDDLLSSTGLADAATLAERFGIDIRSEGFWKSSLSIVERDVQKFERLVAPGTE